MKNIHNLNLVTVHNANDWEAFLAEAPEIYYGRHRDPESAIAKMIISGLNYEHRTTNRDTEKGINLPEYTGRFSVRVSKDLHIKLAREAQRRGISLNALIVQKLSRDFEPEAPTAQWEAHNVTSTMRDVVFELKETTSKRSVRLIFDRNNIADALGDACVCGEGNKEKLLSFIQTPGNRVVYAINKFLAKQLTKRHISKHEISCRLVVVKSDEPINSVLDSLIRFLAYSDSPHNISAKEALNDWDDCLVLEN